MWISGTIHPRSLYCISIFIILKVNKNTPVSQAAYLAAWLFLKLPYTRVIKSEFCVIFIWEHWMFVNKIQYSKYFAPKKSKILFYLRQEVDSCDSKPCSHKDLKQVGLRESYFWPPAIFPWKWRTNLRTWQRENYEFLQPANV